MLIAIAIAAAVSVGLPLFWIWRLARLDEPSRTRWLVRSAELLAGTAFVLMIARWDVVGLHTRTAVVVLLAVAAIVSVRRHVARPWRASGPWPRAERWTALVSLALMAGTAAAGLLPPPGTYPLGCPLAGGRFIVGQGGGNRLVNHHAGHRAQDRAVDIVALGPLGFRADGLLPSELTRYVVYGAAVVSPCEGRVLETRDRLPDLTPPERDRAHPAGNHVVLACGGLRVEIAHLSPGTLAVDPGQEVAPGTPLGRVGNSGNTTEPHLHLHATDAAGGAVPVTLGGVTPVRGRILDC